MYEHIESAQLISKWPQVRGIPYAKYDVRVDGSKHKIININDDALDFLSFLKLIPTNRTTFDNAVSSFMVFSMVSHIYEFSNAIFDLIELIRSRIRTTILTK